VYSLWVKALTICHIKQGQQDVATNFGRARSSGHTKLIAATSDLNVEALFYLSEMFIKLTAKIGQALVIGGFEDYVPKNLDSIQDLYLKPLRRKPPTRKAGVTSCLVKTSSIIALETTPQLDYAQVVHVMNLASLQ
jgi:hypothetical protein